MAFSRETRATLGSTVIERRLPQNADGKTGMLFQNELRHYSQPVELEILRNCSVWAGPGLHTLPPGVNVRYRSKYSVGEVLKISRSGLMALGSRSQKFGPAVWLTDSKSHNYFHWLTDVLPKLWAIRASGVVEPIALPRRLDAFPFVTATLELLREEFFFVPESHQLFFEALYVPGLVSRSGNPRPEILREIGRTLLLNVRGQEHLVGGKSVWVSRKNASKRRVVNEKNIRALLGRHSIRAVHCENLSFSEQVTLFSSASLVVGPHGAGLSNMLFSPEGTKVVEVRRRNDAKNLCYFAMANALGHQYYYVEAAPRMGLMGHNLFVEPGALEFTLDVAGHNDTMLG